MFRYDRTTGPGGGVLVYVLNTLKCTQRLDFQSDDIESIWLEFIQPHTSALFVCILYRPPNMLVNWYDTFEKQIYLASCYTQNIIIMGDVNIDFHKDVPHRWSQLYKSYNLTQIIDEPTRVTEASMTLIDHIYVTHSEYVQASGICKVSLSDHFGIGLCWKSSSYVTKNKHVHISYSKTDNLNDMDSQYIISRNMVKVLEATDIHKTVEIFNNALIDTDTKFLIRRVKRPMQPSWFSKDIYDAIKMRNFLKANRCFNEYKVQRNKVVNMITYAKNNHYKYAIIKCKGNTRKLWKHFKEAIGKTYSPVPYVLKIDGDLLTDSFSIASHFNTYFSSIADKVIASLPHSLYEPSPSFSEF